MNIDMQQNDNRALDDAELCLVQGGANLVDVAKLLVKTLNDALRMGSGRPQA